MFKFYSTHGVPLEVLLFHLHEHNMIPDWLVLYDEMQNEGKMKRKKILSVLETTISDIFGNDFAKEVLRRLELLRPS